MKSRCNDFHPYTSKWLRTSSSIRNNLAKDDYLMELKNQIYSGSEIIGETFFEANPDLYELIIKDYLEYMLDISINEVNVHWCGYSNQNFSKFTHYAIFQE